MSTITNLVTNPSFETNGNGWTNTVGGRDSFSAAAVGTYFMYEQGIGGNTGDNSNILGSGVLQIGVTYRLSFYASTLGSGVSGGVSATHNGVSIISQTVPDGSGWTRYDASFTATAASGISMMIIPGGNDRLIAIDGIMVTETSTLYDYFDGDSADTSLYIYDWTGSAQASTSTRTEIEGGGEIEIPVEPEIDLDKLIMLSEHPLDKIVQTGEFTVSHGGAIATSDSFSVNYPEVRIVESTATNTYGRAGFIRAVYSIDGGNSWEFIDSVKFFVPTVSFSVDSVPVSSDPTVFNRLNIGIGCDEGTIYVKVMGQYFTGNPTANLVTASSITTWSGWTASAQTVLIKYWLFERE